MHGANARWQRRRLASVRHTCTQVRRALAVPPLPIALALKRSFHFWRNRGRPQKKEFACLRHSYHGETLGALSVTDAAIFRDTYDPLLMRAHLVASPDARGADAGETAADVAAQAAADLRRLLQDRHPLIAALIVEPLVQCAAGMAMHDASCLRAVRDLCDEFGVHLVADEIAVGVPSCNAVYQAFLDDDVARGFPHSHSYIGNPLACAAALAALDRLAGRLMATLDTACALAQKDLHADRPPEPPVA